MKIPISIFLAACLIGCVGTYKDQGMDGYRDDGEKYSEDRDSREYVIYDFSKDTKLNGWEVEDDAVMGGRSEGALSISRKGYAVFSGELSIENNGGFSSVQYYFEPIDVTPYRSAVIRLKGDGKRYQFIVESNKIDRHYYVYEFSTGNDWQTVRIPLKEMYPASRGERLDIPNYPGQTMTQVRFLIAGKTPESFSLGIARIWLE